MLQGTNVMLTVRPMAILLATTGATDPTMDARAIDTRPLKLSDAGQQFISLTL